MIRPNFSTDSQGIGVGWGDFCLHAPDPPVTVLTINDLPPNAAPNHRPFMAPEQGPGRWIDAVVLGTQADAVGVDPLVLFSARFAASH